jgi:hypothetical protein
MTTRNSIALSVGVLAVLAAAGCVYPGRQSLATGVVAGLCIATIGLLLFSVAYPTDASSSIRAMVTRHLLGALFRIPLMCGLFAVTILLIRISTVGILIGIAVGAGAFGTVGFVRYLRIAKSAEGR